MNTFITFALVCCIAALVAADGEQQQAQQQQPEQKNSFGLNLGFRRIPGLGLGKKILNGAIDTTVGGLKYVQDRVNEPHRNPLALNVQLGSAAPGGEAQPAANQQQPGGR
ncbi:uncharacterized protein LOC141849155 [Brevipalpus obovatus]|uniref:uncharacterized protein LOC141849155 n=1 Tax=Brevipalpus obovatus TaxID=246614 RepID=UPI003D9F6CBD